MYTGQRGEGAENLTLDSGVLKVGAMRLGGRR